MPRAVVWMLEGFSQDTESLTQRLYVREASTDEMRALLELDSDDSLEGSFSLTRKQLDYLEDFVEGVLEPEENDYELRLALADEDDLPPAPWYTDLAAVWLLRGFSRVAREELVHDFPLTDISDAEVHALLGPDGGSQLTRDQVDRLQPHVGGMADFDRCEYVLREAIIDEAATGGAEGWYPAP